MGKSNGGPSGPSPEQQEQLAASKAKNRRDEQKIAKKQVEGLRAASSKGGLLAASVPALLSAPPQTAPEKPIKSEEPLFGRN